jgi:hypothetical protein
MSPVPVSFFPLESDPQQPLAELSNPSPPSGLPGTSVSSVAPPASSTSISVSELPPRPTSIALPPQVDYSFFLPPMFDPSTELQLKMLVPNSKAGVLIGKAGATINSIRTMSGAKLTVPKEPSQFGDDRLVSFESGVCVCARARAVE